MSEENKASTTPSLINISLPDSLDKAASNLTDKPTQSIGQTVADLWQLVLGGRIAFAAEKQKLKYAQDLEEYKKSLEAKVSAIPEEKQTVPPMQIAAQALEDSQYCIESETLREMFSSLIANSMNIDHSSIIHPSFSKIIHQMSPTDAEMLKLFQKYERRGGIPVVNFIKRNSSGSYKPIIECVPGDFPPSCSQENAARAIESLERLGLIAIPEDASFSDDRVYQRFAQTPLCERLTLDAAKSDYSLEMVRHVAKLTMLGRDFIRVCLD